MRDTSCSDGQINWSPPCGSHGSATNRAALKKAVKSAISYQLQQQRLQDPPQPLSSGHALPEQPPPGNDET